MTTIAGRIKSFRIESGMTQEELARVTGLQAKYISKLERGIQPPGKNAIQKISEAFGIDEMTLRYGERREGVAHQLGDTLMLP